MICNFSTYQLPIELQRLIDNPLLDLSGKCSVSTGETSTKKIYCEKQYLKWAIKNYDDKKDPPEGKPFLKGNLHKYFTNDPLIGNSSQFNVNQIQTAIDQIEQDYQMNASSIMLRSFEFAVNVTGLDKYDLTTETVLDSFVMHEGVRFNKVKNKTRYETTAEHTHYTLKAYDKAAQYATAPTIRFEVHLAAMQPVKEIGIKSLADFKNKDKLKGLQNILMQKTDSLIFLDPLALLNPKITTQQREKLLNGSRPEYWEGLVRDGVKHVAKIRQRYKELVCELAGRNIAEILKTEIENHCNKLLIEENVDCPRFKPLDVCLNHGQSTPQTTDPESTLNHGQSEIESTLNHGQSETILPKPESTLNHGQTETVLPNSESTLNHGQTEIDSTLNHGQSTTETTTRNNHLRQPDQSDSTGMVIFHQWQKFNPKNMFINPKRFPLMTKYNLEMLCDDLYYNQNISIKPSEYYSKYLELLNTTELATTYPKT